MSHPQHTYARAQIYTHVRVSLLDVGEDSSLWMIICGHALFVFTFMLSMKVRLVFLLMLFLKVRFVDDNTRTQWEPVTGGSNVPALNDFLFPAFGMALGGEVLDGEISLSDRRVSEIALVGECKQPRLENMIGTCWRM